MEAWERARLRAPRLKSASRPKRRFCPLRSAPTAALTPTDREPESLDTLARSGYGPRMNRSAEIDVILATLNALDVGTLDSIRAKLSQVEQALRAIGEEELATRSAEASDVLARGNVTEFKRLRATLQAKTGHLR